MKVIFLILFLAASVSADLPVGFFDIILYQLPEKCDANQVQKCGPTRGKDLVYCSDSTFNFTTGCCIANCKTSGGFGCCSYGPNSECCSDGLHCCPSGYRCDLKHRDCISRNSPLFAIRGGSKISPSKTIKRSPNNKPIRILKCLR